MGRDDAEGYPVEHRKFGKLVDRLKELTAAVSSSGLVISTGWFRCLKPRRD